VPSNRTCSRYAPHHRQSRRGRGYLQSDQLGLCQHRLSAGYLEGRRLWLNLKAYDGDNSLVYESGAYGPATGVLTQDPAVKVYEAKPGFSSQLATLFGMRTGSVSTLC
jgi:hypothetical protein